MFSNQISESPKKSVYLSVFKNMGGNLRVFMRVFWGENNMWRSIGKRVQNSIFKFIQAWKKMNLSNWLLLRSVIYFILKIWNLINWIRVKFSLRNSHKNTLWRAEFGTFRNQVLGSIDFNISIENFCTIDITWYYTLYVWYSQCFLWVGNHIYTSWCLSGQKSTILSVYNYIVYIKAKHSTCTFHSW